uniref:Uncharacterized protein n=1 Tax=viral metagenome TaxID=1070528 RepID=A0A6C0LV34_9ZZZZ
MNTISFDLELLNNFMLYVTICIVTFGYFIYRLINKILDENHRYTRVQQYANVLENNEHHILNLFTLIGKIENDFSEYFKFATICKSITYVTKLITKKCSAIVQQYCLSDTQKNNNITKINLANTQMGTKMRSKQIKNTKPIHQDVTYCCPDSSNSNCTVINPMTSSQTTEHMSNLPLCYSHIEHAKEISVFDSLLKGFVDILNNPSMLNLCKNYFLQGFEDNLKNITSQSPLDNVPVQEHITCNTNKKVKFEPFHNEIFKNMINDCINSISKLTNVDLTSSKPIDISTKSSDIPTKSSNIPVKSSVEIQTNNKYVDGISNESEGIRVTAIPPDSTQLLEINTDILNSLFDIVTKSHNQVHKFEATDSSPSPRSELESDIVDNTITQPDIQLIQTN